MESQKTVVLSEYRRRVAPHWGEYMAHNGHGGRAWLDAYNALRLHCERIIRDLRAEGIIPA